MIIKVDEEEFYSLEDSVNHNIGSLTSYALASSIGKNRDIELEEKNKFNPQNNINNMNDSIVLQSKNTSDKGNLDREIEFKKKLKGKFYDEAYNNKRNSLPYPRKKMNLNVWSILKDAVTKDLSKFCVPGKIIF